MIQGFVSDGHQDIYFLEHRDSQCYTRGQEGNLLKFQLIYNGYIPELKVNLQNFETMQYDHCFTIYENLNFSGHFLISAANG